MVEEGANDRIQTFPFLLLLVLGRPLRGGDGGRSWLFNLEVQDSNR
jgi:hypothetical protein